MIEASGQLEIVAYVVQIQLRIGLEKAHKRPPPDDRKLVDYYHADRPAAEREEIQTKWMSVNPLLH